MIAAIEEMIDSVFELDASFPGHERRLSSPRLTIMSSLFAEIHRLTLFLSSKDGFTMIAAIKEMIDSAFELDASFPGHERRLSSSRS
jgi:hypothetical protein